MLNKKAMFVGLTTENWVEYLALLLLFAGFILALATGSAVVSYAVILLCGIVAARCSCTFGKNFKAPLAIIMVGFLAGYLLGVQYGSKKITLIMFIIGYIISYSYHTREEAKKGKERHKKR